MDKGDALAMIRHDMSMGGVQTSGYFIQARPLPPKHVNIKRLNILLVAFFT
jgi:hypothetical protein